MIYMCDVFYAYVPHTAVLTEEYEVLGLFFSGIIPGSEGRDQLVLHYLNNQVID